jgi:hypothetical protein
MSSRCRSKVSDHRCALVDASMSWAVMRTLSPDLCTLPSTTWVAFSVLAIVAMSAFPPLNVKEEVRAMTRRAGA